MVEMNEAIEIVQEVLENNKIDFPKKYIEDLASAYIRRDLSDDELNELVLKVQEAYEREHIEAGEAVGTVANPTSVTCMVLIKKNCLKKRKTLKILADISL